MEFDTGVRDAECTAVAVAGGGETAEDEVDAVAADAAAAGETCAAGEVEAAFAVGADDDLSRARRVDTADNAAEDLVYVHAAAALGDGTECHAVIDSLASE